MYSPRSSLSGSLQEAESLEWFTTKEGNYITSAAYMIAAVSAWIALYERDIVFLQFGKESLTTQFLLTVERFKNSISNSNILWFHYVNGIGEQLIQDGATRPMSFSNFCYGLSKDEDFKAYYSQLFQFLNQVNQGEFEKSLENTLDALSEIKKFLVSKGIVLEMPREFNPS